MNYKISNTARNSSITNTMTIVRAVKLRTGAATGGVL